MSIARGEVLQLGRERASTAAALRLADGSHDVHDIDHIRKYVGVTGSTIGQVELDYLQHITLAAVFRGQVELVTAGLKPVALYFKGGTALQKAEFTDRFSWDFDFSLDMPMRRSLNFIFQSVQRSLQEYGFESTFSMKFNGSTAVAKRDTVVVRLRVKGPSYLKTPKPDA